MVMLFKYFINLILLPLQYIFISFSNSNISSIFILKKISCILIVTERISEKVNIILVINWRFLVVFEFLFLYTFLHI